jgi:hypothetical protein
MGDVGNTYSDLGRHQDALLMKEKTLELYRRIGESHPDVGEGHCLDTNARSVETFFALQLPPSILPLILLHNCIAVL